MFYIGLLNESKASCRKTCHYDNSRRSQKDSEMKDKLDRFKQTKHAVNGVNASRDENCWRRMTLFFTDFFFYFAWKRSPSRSAAISHLIRVILPQLRVIHFLRFCIRSHDFVFCMPPPASLLEETGGKMAYDRI